MGQQVNIRCEHVLWLPNNRRYEYSGCILNLLCLVEQLSNKQDTHLE
jgi:hypothetical protein